MYKERLKQSELWLEKESKYNDMSLEDYIAGLERMKTYTTEYYDHGIISYREYCDNIQAISNEIKDKEKEIAKRDEEAAELEAENEAKAHREIYEKWLSNAVNWKKIRDTYDDWADYDDSPVKFYERCIERVEEMYKAGHIGWQEYMDETMNYSLDLYNAQVDEVDDLLQAQSEHIKKLKDENADSENALKDSWEVEDRKAEMSDIKRQIRIYRNAVTEKGISKYADLQKSLKSLEREEQMYRLQQSNNASITALEDKYELMESNKKLVLSSIQDSGINTEKLISGIRSEVVGIQDIMSDIAVKIINAINSKNTYSDNRSFNISAADSSVLNQFAKNAKEKIARGRYY